MKNLAGFFGGLVFGLGLIISGMGNPEKVRNFLDLFGTWDPSLAFVLGGAIAVAMPGFWLLSRRKKPLFHHTFHLPTRNEIDARLVVGSAVFGVGWGLVGFCPGPALVALPIANPSTLLFIPAMLIGMVLARRSRFLSAQTVPI